jgi:hypothetical protein
MITPHFAKAANGCGRALLDPTAKDRLAF